VPRPATYAAYAIAATRAQPGRMADPGHALAPTGQDRVYTFSRHASVPVARGSAPFVIGKPVATRGSVTFHGSQPILASATDADTSVVNRSASPRPAKYSTADHTVSPLWIVIGWGLSVGGRHDGL
jgi:uncharacterized Zn-binding protein involved in type VI secretion